MNNNIKSARKTYSKPLVAVEDFSLNQFIASCTIKTRNNDNWKSDLQRYSPLDYAQMMATNQFIPDLGCSVHADADAGKPEMDTLCYHTSTSPLFTS